MTHKKIFIGLVSVIVLLSLWTTYEKYFDGTIINPVIKIDNPLAIPTDKSVYHPGDTVQVEMSFCKYRNIPAAVDTSLVDTYIKTYPEEYRSIAQTGCFKNVFIAWNMIPTDATVGRDYYFARKLTYHVNGLRDVVVQLQTTPFTVTK
jgi:hypothetical protein